MTFQLTPSLFDDIFNVLENQEKRFFVDAEIGKLVDESSVAIEDERFYLLPEWNSQNGFELRANFVNGLHSSFVQRHLKDVLYSGRGVFKTFKNELKKYPETEKLWYKYKNCKMRNFISEWYNSLCEVWGLEKLDETAESIEDLDSILQDDFSFEKYTKNNKDDVLLAFDELQKDFSTHYRSVEMTAWMAMVELWKKAFCDFDVENEQVGFVCKSYEGEMAGFITTATVSKRAENVMVITSFFVHQKFRGLGIGNELLEKCLKEAKVLKKEWILLTNVIVPDEMEPLLMRCGFKKQGSGFVASMVSI